MSLRRKPMVGAFVGILAAAAGLTYALGQQDEPVAPSALLPADSVIYVGFDGAAMHEDAWKKTAAYDAFYESGLMDTVSRIVGMAGAQAEAEGEDNPAGQAIEALRHVVERGASVGLTLGERGGLAPWAIVVLHDAADFAPMLEPLATSAAQGEIEFETSDIQGRSITRGVLANAPIVQVGWWAEGGHLVVVAGIDSVGAALRVASGTSANIESTKLWKTYHEADPGFESTSLSWVDFAAIRKAVSGFPVPIPPREPQAEADAGEGAEAEAEEEEPQQPPSVTVGDVFRMLGLDTLNSVVRQSGYRDRAIWSRTVLDAPGERRGLLTLLEQKPFTLGDLPPLPRGAAGFVASSFDWAKAFDAFVGVGKKFEPILGQPGSIDQGLAIMNEHLGISLRDDLLEPMGNVHCAYTDAAQVPFGLGVGIAISLDDAEKVKGSLATALGKVEEAVGQGLRVRNIEKQGREVTLLEIGGGFISPGYCIEDGWLVVGILPQTVEAFLLRKDGRLPSWEPTEELRAALGEVPQEVTAITVTDPRQGYQMAVGFAPFLLGGIRGVLGLTGLIPDPESAISAADLPPAEIVTQPLFPNVSVASLTENGVAYTSRSSVPGVPFLGGAMDGGMAAASSGVLIALLLPAVQQARTAARMTQSKNNLKQMGLAMHNYHDVNNEFMPGTVLNEKLDPEERLSWMVLALPYLEQPAVYDQIDAEEGWESEENAEALKTTIPQFLNPGMEVGEAEYGQTHYVGIGGIGEDGPTLPVTNRKAGIFAYNRATKIGDIADGTSNTMAISESSESSNWGEGGPATIRSLTQQPYINGPDKIGGPYPGGCNVLMTDGSVRFVSEAIDPEVFEALSTINGGEVVGDF